MSLNSIQNPLLASLNTVGRPGAGQVRPGGAGAARTAPTPVPVQPAAVRPQPSLAAPANALPAEAPAGTDPALWGILTTEERAYFAKTAAMGPLTYGRVTAGINAMQQNSPAVRGGRLDVRA